MSQEEIPSQILPSRFPQDEEEHATSALTALKRAAQTQEQRGGKRERSSSSDQENMSTNLGERNRSSSSSSGDGEKQRKIKNLSRRRFNAAGIVARNSSVDPMWMTKSASFLREDEDTDEEEEDDSTVVAIDGLLDCSNSQDSVGSPGPKAFMRSHPLPRSDDLGLACAHATQVALGAPVTVVCYNPVPPSYEDMQAYQKHNLDEYMKRYGAFLQAIKRHQSEVAAAAKDN